MTNKKNYFLDIDRFALSIRLPIYPVPVSEWDSCCVVLAHVCIILRLRHAVLFSYNLYMGVTMEAGSW